jgi:NADH-quinone oxidoreductase subunit C
MNDTDATEETTAPAAPEPVMHVSASVDPGFSRGGDMYEERWHGVIVERDSEFSRGQLVAFPTVDQYVDFVQTLRDDEGFWLCLDVTATDYLAYAAPRPLPAGVEPGRFEVVVLLINARDRSRVRVRLQVPDDDPAVPTLFDVHPGTEACEREVFDMFGIRFEGHPDLTRILMPEDWPQGLRDRRHPGAVQGSVRCPLIPRSRIAGSSRPPRGPRRSCPVPPS